MPRDEPFIIEAFLDSFRLCHTAGMIAVEDWDEVMEKQWRKALSRQGVQVWVAYHPYEKDPIADLYGFLAFERRHGFDDYVLYCYVKQNYRKWKVATGLFQAAVVEKPFRYAVRTPVLTILHEAGKLGGTRWDPLSIRFPQMSPP